MRRLRRFLFLPPAERGLLVRVAILLWAIRLGLWLLPFQSLRRLLARVGSVPLRWRNAGQLSPDRIAWMVAIASRCVPQATCLTQALGAQLLLEREGYPARLHIGVAKGERGQLQAHAWLEHDGQVIVGHQQIQRYTPLLLV